MRTTSILIVSCIVLSCLLLHRTAQAGHIMNAPKYLGLERGLIGFWTFDGKTVVGTRAYDHSGQGNNGTLTGSNGLPVRTAGKIGQALSIDGMDDYVDAANLMSLNDIRPLSVSAWIYPKTFGRGGHGRIINKDNGGGGGTVTAFLVNNTISLRGWNFLNNFMVDLVLTFILKIPRLI